MVSGAGSSLIPGLGVKVDAAWYIFTGVGVGGGGDTGGGKVLGPPRRPSSGELMVMGGGDKLPGEQAPGLPGWVSPA